MTLIDDIMADLKVDEGFRSSVYQDSLGFWTIGYGTLVDQRKMAGITPQEAEYLARNRIQIMVAGLVNRFPGWDKLSERRQKVLVNMATTLGVDGLLQFKKMIAAIQAEDWQKAHDEMLDSDWAKQVKGRSVRLSQIMLEG